ncbi:hypothetical protein BN12_4200005 [Nostocoides japonicum T1-X7]|uniref:Uncharacterized protein n=1 Tax=Nostocoides japonicum T1-X7 TaxID=1194083 RepID=A0A077LUL2_9MICO|nr:hypothetical protein BN12_200044 [Tetrasphaera japonica T1-X7]CCH79387.1 hypothetical protein BN12_4200005 [Tetrasphaera japonica T1-X7]
MFAMPRSHGSSDPSASRTTLPRARHASRNTMDTTSSARSHEAVRRNAWLYTAEEWRRNSSPNADASPPWDRAHSTASESTSIDALTPPYARRRAQSSRLSTGRCCRRYAVLGCARFGLGGIAATLALLLVGRGLPRHTVEPATRASAEDGEVPSFRQWWRATRLLTMER